MMQKFMMFAGDPYNGTIGAENFCGMVTKRDADRMAVLMVTPGECFSAHLASFDDDNLRIWYMWDDSEKCFQHKDDYLANQESKEGDE